MLSHSHSLQTCDPQCYIHDGTCRKRHRSKECTKLILCASARKGEKWSCGLGKDCPYKGHVEVNLVGQSSSQHNRMRQPQFEQLSIQDLPNPRTIVDPRPDPKTRKSSNAHQTRTKTNQPRQERPNAWGSMAGQKNLTPNKSPAPTFMAATPSPAGSSEIQFPICPKTAGIDPAIWPILHKDTDKKKK